MPTAALNRIEKILSAVKHIIGYWLLKLVIFPFGATNCSEVTHFTFMLSDTDLTIESMLMSLVYLNNRIQSLR